MKIAIGCDPNAEEAKQEIIAYIEKKGYGEVTDFGSEDPIYANVADRKSTRLNSSHASKSRMPSSA